MKKLFCIIWTALFLLSVGGAAAYADVLIEGPEYVSYLYGVWPWVLIGVAVIAAAVLIRRMRRK